MKLEVALKVIAELIWNKGETEFLGQGCLVPSDFVDDSNVGDYHRASDELEKLGYTHYDRKWNEKGKSVKLNFYGVEEFGAAVVKEKDFIKEYIVEI